MAQENDPALPSAEISRGAQWEGRFDQPAVLARFLATRESVSSLSAGSGEARLETPAGPVAWQVGQTNLLDRFQAVDGTAGRYRLVLDRTAAGQGAFVGVVAGLEPFASTQELFAYLVQAPPT